MRTWTGVVGDSSSCSDESSNGETPWMMGLDLVSTMEKRFVVFSVRNCRISGISFPSTH